MKYETSIRINSESRKKLHIFKIRNNCKSLSEAIELLLVEKEGGEQAY